MTDYEKIKKVFDEVGVKNEYSGDGKEYTVITLDDDGEQFYMFEFENGKLMEQAPT